MEHIRLSEITDGRVFEEQTDYVLLLDCSTDETPSKYRGILRMFTHDVGVLNFGNCVGRFDFFGKAIEVRSKKISSEQYTEMLIYISEKLAELLFSFGNLAKDTAEIDETRIGGVLYHTYLILRYIILNHEENLEGAFEYIFRNPARRMKRERAEADTWEATHITVDTLIDLAARPERLVVLPGGNRLVNTAVSRYLSRGVSESRFPLTVTTLRAVNTLDTPENRFVKHFLMICENILYSFRKRIAEISALNGMELVRDIGIMSEKVNMLLVNSFFNEIGEFTGFPGNSTIMQKRHGYKEILKFYNLIQSAVRFPIFEDSIRIVIENRNIAELYEIWAYFRIVDLIGEIIGSQPVSANIYNVSDYSASLKYNACVIFNHLGRKIAVWYNRTFTRSNGGSYSLPLRPDIVVETVNGLHIFDAKFRLRAVDWDEETQEMDYTFWNDDIYKMHTYKDAIRSVKTATILYPNEDADKSWMFWDDKEKHSCVGAYALLPGRSPDRLKDFIEKFVIIAV